MKSKNIHFKWNNIKISQMKWGKINLVSFSDFRIVDKGLRTEVEFLFVIKRSMSPCASYLFEPGDSDIYKDFLKQTYTDGGRSSGKVIDNQAKRDRIRPYRTIQLSPWTDFWVTVCTSTLFLVWILLPLIFIPPKNWDCISGLLYIL